MTDERVAEGDRPERCLLLGLDLPTDNWPVEESLDELERLVTSAGAVPVGRLVQSRSAPDPRTHFGPGKVEEAAQLAAELGADMIVIDGELTPAQGRNLERAVECKVIDRTQLILDIFAQRARTKEGKLQVELAQLQYVLPRLSGIGATLSRLGGGIGTRGPGETKLEVDRRRIRARMAELRRAIDEVKRKRALHREGRRSALAPVVALVGYTNAGKSTLLNALTDAGAYADDRLFATLDPTVRSVTLPQGGAAMIVDTVGFIRKLPTDLVAAFRATLEEVNHADALVHVVDISSDQWYQQAYWVHQVMNELGAAGKPTVTAFNKADAADPLEVEAALRRTQHSVAVSARDKSGLGRLLEVIGELVPEPWVRWELEIPYDQAHVVSWLHEHGNVTRASYDPDAVRIEAELRKALAERVAGFRASTQS